MTNVGRCLAGLAGALLAAACGSTVLVEQGSGGTSSGATSSGVTSSGGTSSGGTSGGVGGTGGAGVGTSGASVGGGGGCTCANQGANCGVVESACGDTLDCGACPPGETCGGGGEPNVCAPVCDLPVTCAEAGVNCGPLSDGCGGIIECGFCMQPQTCGGGGVPNVCGPTSGTTCQQACIDDDAAAYALLVDDVLMDCGCGAAAHCAFACTAECADPSTLTAGSACGTCLTDQTGPGTPATCVMSAVDACQADPACDVILTCEAGC